MQPWAWSVGLCVLVGYGGVLRPVEAIASDDLSVEEALTTEDIFTDDHSDQNEAAIIPQPRSITLLRFETQHYIVRIYQDSELTYLNVYNKETGFTDKNGVLAILAEPEDEEDSWLTYMNLYGDLEYRARVNPEGETELEIRVAGGPPAQPELGFNASYSFPHVYLGADVENTVAILTESGWVVDFTDQSAVELTRDESVLGIKFDPDTQTITYTQLVDLL
ncbi:hypothetical protein PN498_01705 [Oscillatoria sp. CS-180]|nr:hypothetical protein [Oscillatoria sp. CS-180]